MNLIPQLTQQSRIIRAALGETAKEIDNLDLDVCLLGQAGGDADRKELEKELNRLRRSIESLPSVAPFSAASGDIFAFIESLFEQGEVASDEERAEIYQRLGLGDYDPDYRQYWLGLSQFIERGGFSSQKQEDYISEAQRESEPLFDHFMIEPPFPQLCSGW